MILLATGLLFLTEICWVDVHGAVFTTEVCDNHPCARENVRISFKLSGTPSPNAVRSVGFYKNGESGIRVCGIDRQSTCNATASCGCTEAGGGDRVYHYKSSSASTTNDDGNWTAILLASSDPDILRSPVCRVQVNTSCPYFVRDACPAGHLTAGDLLHIAFVQTRTFPSTSGASLNFVVTKTTTNVEGTVRWSACPQINLPAGCFERSGQMVYYLNITAETRHTGSWAVVVDANPSTDTVQSDVCEVFVLEPQEVPISTGLVSATAVITAIYIVLIIIAIPGGCCFKNKRGNAVMAFVGALVVLIFVITIGVYSLGVYLNIIRLFNSLYNANIAFVVIGVIAVLGGCIFGIMMWIKSKSPGRKKP